VDIKNKWFHRIEKRHQLRIFSYLDKLANIKNHRLKVETMMHKTKYLEEFCEECVEEWNRHQENKALRPIQDRDGPPNMESEQSLF